MPTFGCPLRYSMQALVGSIAIAGLTGCATPSQPSVPPVAPASVTIALSPAPATPVVRYGRYTLVELTPRDDQRDLMEQVIDVAIPAPAHATLGDALHYVLQRSGYRLCGDHPDLNNTLFVLPFPARAPGTGHLARGAGTPCGIALDVADR